MPAEFGPGRYDDLCTYVREQSQAAGAIVIVLGGNRGFGFSVQLDARIMGTTDLAKILRYMADDIEGKKG